MKGEMQMQTTAILQENTKPIMIPTKIAHIDSNIDANPSVDTPLMSYASLERVDVKILGAFSY
jgi:hypothetical protein